ncbi:MAG TPA: sigma-70 family RNA polymerase sigma factor [Thermoanaerobaculia bacterium]|nr:sigma-70 family RNA polymerase sigma factor [Thermoanaerobaculia bacterium]
MTSSQVSGEGGGNAELVHRIVAGDREAEAELVARYSPVLEHLLRRWSRDPATAEDLLQETLGLALRKIREGEVRQPESLGAFLHSLARNQSVQLYRRTENRTDRHEPLDEVRLPEARPGQLAGLLRQEKIGLIRQVLAELRPERDRQILYRYYIAEERAEPICADLGITAEHFYRVLHRARQRYKALLEQRIG